MCSLLMCSSRPTPLKTYSVVPSKRTQTNKRELDDDCTDAAASASCPFPLPFDLNLPPGSGGGAGVGFYADEEDELRLTALRL